MTVTISEAQRAREAEVKRFVDSLSLERREELMEAVRHSVEHAEPSDTYIQRELQKRELRKSAGRENVTVEGRVAELERQMKHALAALQGLAEAVAQSEKKTSELLPVAESRAQIGRLFAELAAAFGHEAEAPE